VEKIHAGKKIAFYIVDLKKFPICGLDRFNHRKDGSDDENCNKNTRKGGTKKMF
jgi:hypothetical protein